MTSQPYLLAELAFYRACGILEIQKRPRAVECAPSIHFFRIAAIHWAVHRAEFLKFSIVQFICFATPSPVQHLLKF